jgi:hypothetical protein
MMDSCSGGFCECKRLFTLLADVSRLSSGLEHSGRQMLA